MFLQQSALILNISGAGYTGAWELTVNRHVQRYCIIKLHHSKYITQLNHQMCLKQVRITKDYIFVSGWCWTMINVSFKITSCSWEKAWSQYIVMSLEIWQMLIGTSSKYLQFNWNDFQSCRLKPVRFLIVLLSVKSILVHLCFPCIISSFNPD